ncbi:MAG: Gfo/Idh/MocA family protein [Pikeienuella sp.]
MKPVRTAVVGVGHFGRLHAEKLASDGRAELVAVVDVDPDRARKVAECHGTRLVTDHRALLGQVDAVTIAVPTAAHYEIARFFLDNGVHVLVEKPFTSTVDEADDLIRRARAGGLVLQVGHLERFFCAKIGLLQSVSRPLYIEALRISPFRPRGSDVSVVLDLMIHDIDLIASLVDAPIKSVDAVGAPVLSQQEDIANARLLFENGCVATVTASRVAFKSERRVRVFQPDGLLSIDLLKRRVGVIRKTMQADNPNFDVEEREFGEQDPLRDEIMGFIEAVATGGVPLVTGEDGRAALVIAQRVTESLRAHRALVAEHLPEARSAETGQGAPGDGDQPRGVSV